MEDQLGHELEGGASFGPNGKPMKFYVVGRSRSSEFVADTEENQFERFPMPLLPTVIKSLLSNEELDKILELGDDEGDLEERRRSVFIRMYERWNEQSSKRELPRLVDAFSGLNVNTNKELLGKGTYRWDCRLQREGEQKEFVKDEIDSLTKTELVSRLKSLWAFLYEMPKLAKRVICPQINNPNGFAMFTNEFFTTLKHNYEPECIRVQITQGGQPTLPETYLTQVLLRNGLDCDESVFATEELVEQESPSLVEQESPSTESVDSRPPPRPPSGPLPKGLNLFRPPPTPETQSSSSAPSQELSVSPSPIQSLQQSSAALEQQEKTLEKKINTPDFKSPLKQELFGQDEASFSETPIRFSPIKNYLEQENNDLLDKQTPNLPTQPALQFSDQQIRDNQVALREEWGDFAYIWNKLWIDLAKIPPNVLIKRYEHGIGPLAFRKGLSVAESIFFLQASIAPSETMKSAIFPDCEYTAEKIGTQITKDAGTISVDDRRTNLYERGFLWYALRLKKRGKKNGDFKISYSSLFADISSNILTKQFLIGKSWEYIFRVEMARSGLSLSIVKGSELSDEDKNALREQGMSVFSDNDYYMAKKDGKIASAVSGKDWNTSEEAKFLSVVPSNQYIYGPKVKIVNGERVGINAESLPFRSVIVQPPNLPPMDGGKLILDDFQSIREFYPLIKTVNNAYYFQDSFGPLRSFVQLFAMVRVANSDKNYTGLLSKMRQRAVPSGAGPKIYLPDMKQLAENLEILGFSRAFNSTTLHIKDIIKDIEGLAVLGTIKKSEDETDLLYGEGPYKIVNTPAKLLAVGLAGEVNKVGITTNEQCARLSEIYLNTEVGGLSGLDLYRAICAGVSDRQRRLYLPFLCARVMPTAEEILGSYAMFKVSSISAENLPANVQLNGSEQLGGGELIELTGGQHGHSNYIEGGASGKSVVGSVVGSVVNSLVGSKTQLTHLEDSTKLDNVPHNTLWDTNFQAQQFAVTQ